MLGPLALAAPSVYPKHPPGHNPPLLLIPPDAHLMVRPAPARPTTKLLLLLGPIKGKQVLDHHMAATAKAMGTAWEQAPTVA